MQADPMCSEYNNKQIRQQSLEPRCWPWPRHQNPSIPPGFVHCHVVQTAVSNKNIFEGRADVDHGSEAQGGCQNAQVLLSRGTYDGAGVDVWAAGVVLFQMLTGRLPFCHDARASGCLDHAMMQRIIKGQCVTPHVVHLHRALPRSSVFLS